MSEQIIHLNATPTLELQPGEVALVIPTSTSGETELRLHHNIQSITDDGTISAENGDISGVIIALTFAELMETDDQAFKAAVLRVMTKLQGKVFKLVSIA